MTSATWHHDGPVLNVCFAYTGREDIAQAVASAGEGVRRGEVAAAVVDERLLERCLHGAAIGASARLSKTMEATSDDAEMDEIARGDEERRCEERRCEEALRVEFLFARGRRSALGHGRLRRERIAANVLAVQGGRAVDDRRRERAGGPFDSNVGETRLSDFILWGVSQHAVLLFMEVLWPDFSFTDMCHAVWAYQRSARHAMDARRRFRAARARAARRTPGGGRAKGRGEEGRGGGLRDVGGVGQPRRRSIVRGGTQSSQDGGDSARGGRVLGGGGMERSDLERAARDRRWLVDARQIWPRTPTTVRNSEAV